MLCQTALTAMVLLTSLVGVEADPAQERKDFAEAARHYAELHAGGASNVELFRSWGNAELLAERVPHAILAYRRGLRLDPGNADLLAGLRFARNQVAYPAGPAGQPPHDDSRMSIVAHWVPWLPRYLRLLLCLGTLLLYSLACVASMRWYFVRRTFLPVRALSLLILAATCAFYWHGEEAQLIDDQAHPFVVIERDTGLYRGNGDSYPYHESVPTLFAGMEARQILRRGDWLQIQLPGGTMGWVSRRAVVVDEPLN